MRVIHFTWQKSEKQQPLGAITIMSLDRTDHLESLSREQNKNKQNYERLMNIKWYYDVMVLAWHCYKLRELFKSTWTNVLFNDFFFMKIPWNWFNDVDITSFITFLKYIPYFLKALFRKTCLFVNQFHCIAPINLSEIKTAHINFAIIIIKFVIILDRSSVK